MVVGILDSNMQNENGPLSYSILKNQVKMNERPNVRQKTIRILEKNTGSNSLTSGIATSYRHISRGKGEKQK